MKKHSIEITKRFLKAMDLILADRGMKAGEFGEVVGMPASNISRLRAGGSNYVTLEAAAIMCKLYKISPSWLILGEGDMNLSEPSVLKDLMSRVAKLEKVVKG